MNPIIADIAAERLSGVSFSQPVAEAYSNALNAAYNGERTFEAWEWPSWRGLRWRIVQTSIRWHA